MGPVCHLLTVLRVNRLVQFKGEIGGMKRAKHHKDDLKAFLKAYRYQPALTAELDRLGSQPFAATDVDKIVLWKVNRYVHLSDAAMKALNNAAKLKPRLHRKSKGVVVTLLQEAGVDLPMASTFLRFRNPKAFQIIDRHAYRAIYGVDYPLYSSTSDDKKVQVYFDYLDELFALADTKHLSFETLDRVLYVFDKETNGGL